MEIMLIKKKAVAILFMGFIPITLSAKNNLANYSAGDSTQMSAQEIIIAKERAALDRWKTGDTFGFIEAAATEITYFDPGLDRRCTGIKEFHDWLAAANGTFSFPGYELLNPQVQLHGSIGVLTFNFVGFMKDGSKNNWNATEVYALIDGDWEIVSSHWSHTKP
jgi:hypothetical protein